MPEPALAERRNHTQVDDGDGEEDKELSKAEVKDLIAKCKEMESKVAKLAKV